MQQYQRNKSERGRQNRNTRKHFLLTYWTRGPKVVWKRIGKFSSRLSYGPDVVTKHTRKVKNRNAGLNIVRNAQREDDNRRTIGMPEKYRKRVINYKIEEIKK